MTSREPLSLDLDAAIVPGQGAAGLLLGQEVETVLHANPGVFHPEPIDTFGHSICTRYRSPHVDLWEWDGRLRQIMVHGRYRGLLLGRIGVGATIAVVERLIGPVGEDWQDLLVLPDYPGVCFEFLPPPGADRRTAPIEETYVYLPETPEEHPNGSVRRWYAGIADVDVPAPEAQREAMIQVVHPTLFLMIEDREGVHLRRYAAPDEELGETIHDTVEEAREWATWECGEALGVWAAVPMTVEDVVGYARAKLRSPA